MKFKCSPAHVWVFGVILIGVLTTVLNSITVFENVRDFGAVIRDNTKVPVEFTVKNKYEKIESYSSHWFSTVYVFDMDGPENLQYTMKVSHQTYTKYNVGSKVRFDQSKIDLYCMNQDYKGLAAERNGVALICRFSFIAILLIWTMSGPYDIEDIHEKSIAQAGVLSWYGSLIASGAALVTTVLPYLIVWIDLRSLFIP